MARRYGTTSEEIELALHMSHQNVSARRTELRHWGYTDYAYNGANEPMRRPTNSGRSAFVQIATKKGKECIKNGWRIGDAGDPTAGRHGGDPMSSEAFAKTDHSESRWKVLKHMVVYS